MTGRRWAGFCSERFRPPTKQGWWSGFARTGMRRFRWLPSRPERLSGMCCFQGCARLLPRSPLHRWRSAQIGDGGASAPRRGHTGAARRRRLVEAGLDRARQENWRGAVVLGDPAYYPRFGFRPDTVRGMASPYAGPALMGLAFAEGSLSGPRIEHAPAFTSL